MAAAPTNHSPRKIKSPSVAVAANENDTDNTVEEMESVQMSSLIKLWNLRYILFLVDTSRMFSEAPEDLLDLLNKVWYNAGLERDGKIKNVHVVQEYTQQFFCKTESEGFVVNTWPRRSNNQTHCTRNRVGQGNSSKLQGQEPMLKDCTFDYPEDPQSTKRYRKNVELLMGFIVANFERRQNMQFHKAVERLRLDDPPPVVPYHRCEYH